MYEDQPEDTYVRGNRVVKVSPPSARKQQKTEVMGETSAPSGLLRQGNEPSGEGRPMSKAARQRKNKIATPTQKPVLPYNALKNDPYFVKWLITNT